MDDNLYQPPGVDASRELNSGDFGRFDFSRAFTLGWDGFQRNMGIAIGTVCLLFLAIIAALFVIPLVGYIVLYPHLVLLGMPLAGLYAVRGKLELSHGFLGIQKFGAVLMGGLIWFAALGMLLLIFSGPTYYMMFQHVDWSADLQAIFEAVGRSSEKVPLWMTGWSYLGSIVSWYITARLMLLLPLIVERDLEAGEAFSASLQATSGDQLSLAVYIFVTNLIAGVGAILCGIGLLFTAPLSMVLQGAAIYMLLGEDKTDK